MQIQLFKKTLNFRENNDALLETSLPRNVNIAKKWSLFLKRSLKRNNDAHELSDNFLALKWPWIARVPEHSNHNELDESIQSLQVRQVTFINDRKSIFQPTL